MATAGIDQFTEEAIVSLQSHAIRAFNPSVESVGQSVCVWSAGQSTTVRGRSEPTIAYQLPCQRLLTQTLKAAQFA